MQTAVTNSEMYIFYALYNDQGQLIALTMIFPITIVRQMFIVWFVKRNFILHLISVEIHWVV